MLAHYNFIFDNTLFLLSDFIISTFFLPRLYKYSIFIFSHKSLTSFIAPAMGNAYIMHHAPNIDMEMYFLSFSYIFFLNKI